MSADKHRRLAIEIAYLRLATREYGMSLNVKWARGITTVIRDMIAGGDIVQRRIPMGGRKTVTTMFATEQGRGKLDAALVRHGKAFGPVTGLDRIEPVRVRKEVRQRQAITPTQRRADRQRRQAVAAAWLLTAKGQSTRSSPSPGEPGRGCP